MELSDLHQQKIVLLSRLIKESSLTLEEALLLLKEEQTEKVMQPDQVPVWTPGTTRPWIQPYSYGSGTIPLKGTITGILGDTTTATSTAPFGTYTHTSSSYAGQVLEQLIKESKDATI